MTLGIGAMIHYLGGGSENDPSKYVKRDVVAAVIADDRLTLTLDGGQKIQIWDDYQSCCEHRYMTTDDDLSNIVGGKLIHIISKPGPDVKNEDEYSEEHEQVFVEVQTTTGLITIVNHNEHNGYYGGFGLKITEMS